MVNTKEIKSFASQNIMNKDLIIASGILSIISVIAGMFAQAGAINDNSLLKAIGLGLGLFCGTTAMGYQRHCLSVVRGKPKSWTYMFKITSKGPEAKRITKLYCESVVRIGIGFILFVVPGIIMSYQYAMAVYILKDNPNLSAKECLQASKEMMKGNKFNLFKFQLSFIGWEILTSMVTTLIAFILGLFLPSIVVTVVCSLCAIPLMNYLALSMACYYECLSE